MARTIRQSDFEKKDFVAQDLIEKLTHSVDLKQQQHNANNVNAARQGFNPRDYLLKFETAIEQIRNLRNHVDEEIEKSISNSKKDEANYKSQLSGFMTDLHSIMHDFRILDGGISKVSQTAIRIGDRLETVEDQRQQILESEELIGHFLRFNKAKQYRDIDKIFIAESGDDLYKAARLIIKLHDIGTDLTSPETMNARDEITKIANRIKKNLKDEFIRAYQAKRDDNHKEMKECATILDEFHDKEAFEEFLTLYLRDVDFHTYPSTSFDEVRHSIVQFMNDLSRVIETACKSIVRVFPKPEMVIKDLIIKAFREQILSYLLNATQPILLGAQLGAVGVNLANNVDNASSNPFAFTSSNPSSPDLMPADENALSVETPTGGVARSSGIRGNLNQLNLAELGNGNASNGHNNTSHAFMDNIGETGNMANASKLSKKELEEYLSIINVVFKNTNSLLQELKTKVLEIVFGSNKDEEDDKREKMYSVRHIIEEEKLMRIVFEKHQDSYLKLEVKHLKNSLRELIKEHVIGPLKLDDDELSDDEFEPSLTAPNQHEDAFEMASATPLSITVEDAEEPAATSLDNKKQARFNLGAAFRGKAPMGGGRKMTASQLMQSTRSYSQKKLKKMKKMLPTSMSSKEFEEVLARLRNVFQFGINECVATMKKKVATSLKRCVNISSPKDISENIHRVFLVYLDSVDTLFRKTLIPICKETLPKKGVKEIKHWYFLEAVHHTNSALQLVEQCFINEVAPNITDSFQSWRCKEDKNRVYADFEQDILSGLKELLAIGLNIADTIMRKEQQKSDFKPKQDDVEMLGETNACKKACQFINEFRGRSLICLDGRNLDRFFLCLGTRLYYNIIEHLKDYQYNHTGAMILVQDAKLYQSTVKEFHIEKINELFLTLVERTNLISIPADSIVPYIENDPRLSKIDKNELKQWLKLRNDYKSAKIDSKLFE
eukprot:CAMPEP_0197032588 /NCGR_PEP_ID=MMETSP1384-20130603/11228_1 /TAXON_ID=29189 /ORGANISM="Ammonia sp." /LENGTH=949 /DNA_ID=CAMNT_0042462273 /DNA_START=24 /DNA_END=2873 /DNA_ORIENTATION=+